MYCTECYIQHGQGTVDAPYIYGGKSLCYIHFWEETKKQVTEHLPAVVEKPKRKRGCRIPENFMPTQETIDQIRAEFPYLSSEALIAEHRKFCDYWNAKTGAQATKMDWDATWRNWMRKSQENVNGRAVAARTNTDDKVQGWLDLGGPDGE